MQAIQIKPAIYSGVLLFFMNGTVAGQDLSEIQRQFNAETINKPFNVPDDATLTKALNEATARGKPTRSPGYPGGCVGLGCALGNNFGYGSYFGGYTRPYYGGFYGAHNYLPYYYGW